MSTPKDVAIAMFAPLDYEGFHPSASQVTEAQRVIALVAKDIEFEREDWRGKAERYLSEWRNNAVEAEEAVADRDEAESVKEMWRKRALDAERELEKVIGG